MSIKDRYNKKVVPELQKKLGFENIMQAPRIEKVVVNVGIGKFLKDGNQINEVKESIRNIVGQNPIMTKAKTSIAGFKTRQGMEVGIRATLRGQRKWDFLEKLVGAAIPRVRDFRGIKKTAIDKSGNLNLGVKEHLIFPEIMPEQVRQIFSLQINITTTAKNYEEGLELFKQLGFPMEE